MSFRTMKYELMAFAPELSAIQAGIRLNRSYQHLLALHPWSFIKGDALLKLQGPYVTGTIDVTNGLTTVAGNGTTWTSAMVGRALQVGSAMVYYRIASVTPPNALTLEATFGETTQTGAAYRIFQNIYSIPTDAADILAIRYNYNLDKATKMWLDDLDPTRESTGEPSAWLPITNNTLEIWPVPDQNYTVRVWYNKAYADLSAETDTPAIPDGVIIAHAKLETCLTLSTGVGLDPNVSKQYLSLYATMVQDTGPSGFRALWQAAIEEDTRKLSLPRTVQDVGWAGRDDNQYLLSHDVGDPRRP